MLNMQQMVLNQDINEDLNSFFDTISSSSSVYSMLTNESDFLNENLNNITIENSLSSIRSIFYNRLRHAISYDYIKINYNFNEEFAYLPNNDQSNKNSLYYLERMCKWKMSQSNAVKYCIESFSSCLMDLTTEYDDFIDYCIDQKLISISSSSSSSSMDLRHVEFIKLLLSPTQVITTLQLYHNNKEGECNDYMYSNNETNILEGSLVIQWMLRMCLHHNTTTTTIDQLAASNQQCNNNNILLWLDQKLINPIIKLLPLSIIDFSVSSSSKNTHSTNDDIVKEILVLTNELQLILMVIEKSLFDSNQTISTNSYDLLLNHLQNYFHSNDNTFDLLILLNMLIRTVILYCTTASNSTTTSTDTGLYHVSQEILALPSLPYDALKTQLDYCILNPSSHLPSSTDVLVEDDHISHKDENYCNSNLAHHNNNNNNSNGISESNSMMFNDVGYMYMREIYSDTDCIELLNDLPRGSFILRNSNSNTLLSPSQSSKSLLVLHSDTTTESITTSTVVESQILLSFRTDEVKQQDVKHAVIRRVIESDSTSIDTTSANTSSASNLQQPSIIISYFCGKLGPVDNLDDILHNISDILDSPLLFHNPVLDDKFLRYYYEKTHATNNTTNSSNNACTNMNADNISRTTATSASVAAATTIDQQSLKSKLLLKCNRYNVIDINRSMWTICCYLVISSGKEKDNKVDNKKINYSNSSNSSSNSAPEVEKGSEAYGHTNPNPTIEIYQSLLIILAMKEFYLSQTSGVLNKVIEVDSNQLISSICKCLLDRIENFVNQSELWLDIILKPNLILPHSNRSSNCNTSNTKDNYSSKYSGCYDSNGKSEIVIADQLYFSISSYLKSRRHSLSSQLLHTSNSSSSINSTLHSMASNSNNLFQLGNMLLNSTSTFSAASSAAVAVPVCRFNGSGVGKGFREFAVHQEECIDITEFKTILTLWRELYIKHENIKTKLRLATTNTTNTTSSTAGKSLLTLTNTVEQPDTSSSVVGPHTHTTENTLSRELYDLLAVINKDILEIDVTCNTEECTNRYIDWLLGIKVMYPITSKPPDHLALFTSPINYYRYINPYQVHVLQDYSLADEKAMIGRHIYHSSSTDNNTSNTRTSTSGANVVQPPPTTINMSTHSSHTSVIMYRVTNVLQEYFKLKLHESSSQDKIVIEKYVQSFLKLFSQLKAEEYISNKFHVCLSRQTHHSHVSLKAYNTNSTTDTTSTNITRGTTLGNSSNNNSTGRGSSGGEERYMNMIYRHCYFNTIFKQLLLIPWRFIPIIQIDIYALKEVLGVVHPVSQLQAQLPLSEMFILFMPSTQSTHSSTIEIFSIIKLINTPTSERNTSGTTSTSAAQCEDGNYLTATHKAEMLRTPFQPTLSNTANSNSNIISNGLDYSWREQALFRFALPDHQPTPRSPHSTVTSKPPLSTNNITTSNDSNNTSNTTVSKNTTSSISKTDNVQAVVPNTVVLMVFERTFFSDTLLGELHLCLDEAVGDSLQHTSNNSSGGGEKLTNIETASTNCNNNRSSNNNSYRSNNSRKNSNSLEKKIIQAGWFPLISPTTSSTSNINNKSSYNHNTTTNSTNNTATTAKKSSWLVYLQVSIKFQKLQLHVSNKTTTASINNSTTSI